jgi:hypothetical protein
VTEDRDYVSTGDFALTEVRTFDDLLPYLRRLRARAGEPSYRAIERRTKTTKDIYQLGRNRMTKILANGELKRDELKSFLFAHRVRPEDYPSWYDAHGRAAEHQAEHRAAEHQAEHRAAEHQAEHRAADQDAPGATTQARPSATYVGDVAYMSDADASSAVGWLLRVRERCLTRLRRLNRELDHVHATAGTDGDHAARLVRTVDFAVSRLREILDEVCAEVMAVTSAAGVTAASEAPQPSGVADSDADSEAANSDSAAGPDTAAQADTATLTWAANVMGAIPLPVFATWLRLQPPAVFNVVARERPQLMASLLATVPVPDEAAAWLLTWEQESAAQVLAAAGPEEAERYLTAMAPQDAACLLIHMNPLTAARTLTAMRREVATGHLMAIGATAGTPILERLDRDVCAGVLFRMHGQDKALAEEFLRGMDAQAASACLERMDEQMADQRQARDLLQKVSQRDNSSGGSSAPAT